MKTLTKRTRRKPLPNKMSDLIELCVEDCLKIDKLKTVHLNMNTFGELEGKDCYVCMGAAVMYQQFGRDYIIHDRRVPLDALKKMRALDEIRIGAMRLAYTRFHKKPLVEPSDQAKALTWASDIIQSRVVTYPEGWRAAWDTYLQVAKRLREVGL